MNITAFIALGSNLGDRKNYLDRALEMLQEQAGIVVTQVSSYVETAPVGGPPGQGNYLNAAAEIQTDLEPDALLQVLHDVERSLGRVRGEHHGPRTLDLDLLLYGDLICEQSTLTVPHPRLHDRLFVLEPMSEIAPQVIHPILKRTMAELCMALHPAAGNEPASTAAPPSPRPPVPPSSLPSSAAGELTGLRALVTGSTSGIGRAIALELAAGGADVIVHGRRSRAAAEAVADQIRACGVRSGALLADLRQPEECALLVESAFRQGPLDVWINNAGADTLTGEAAHWPFERKLEELFLVDVRATMLLSRDVGRRMREAGGGVLLNMGWDQAETGMEGDSGQLFGAVKAAVMAFSKSLALTLAPTVRVNCLAPGWIRTAWGEGASATWQERVLRETPLQRWGTPEDVAATARWLVSPAASFLTGQIIRVNGGAVC